MPVSAPGALLYLGDGHAAQGDGELNGNALETSMDVEFTVDVVSGKSIRGPRVESATHIMAMGLAGSIDDAFRSVTANMAQWLADDYKLTPSEVAEVLGTAAEYKVSEAASQRWSCPQDQQGSPPIPSCGEVALSVSEKKGGVFRCPPVPGFSTECP